MLRASIVRQVTFRHKARVPAPHALGVKVVMARGGLALTALSARTHRAERFLALIAPRADTTLDLKAQLVTLTL